MIASLLKSEKYSDEWGKMNPSEGKSLDDVLDETAASAVASLDEADTDADARLAELKRAEELSQRADYTDGLRQLADLLDEHPEVPLPYTGNSPRASQLLWILSGGEQRTQLAAIARALPGRLTKEVRGEAFDLIGSLAGLHVQAIATRDAVCERIVRGVQVVVRTVPDPDFDVPLVEITERVEEIDWVCGSILGDR